MTKLNPNILLVTGALLMVAAMYMPRAYDNSPLSYVPAIVLFLFGVAAFSVGFVKEENRK